MPNHICPGCEKSFYHKKSMQKFCERKCFLKHKKKHSKKTRKEVWSEKLNKMIASKSKSSKCSTKRSLKRSKLTKLYKEREKFKDRIIDYPESPTGKAYVGINKEPFMKADTGHGYQGVVMQDDSRSFVQCHGCGKWAKVINETHIKKCLGVTTREYKKRFGIGLSTGLVSDATSMKCTKAALKNKSDGWKKHKYKTGVVQKKINKMGLKKGRDNKSTTIEYENKYGTCPLQLKTRMYEFILMNRELPSSGNRGYSIRKALIRRHKTWSDALEHLGLPRLQRKGTNMKYTFPDHTIYHYNINKMHDREGLYKRIIDKCPEVQAYIKENNISLTK